MLLTASYPYSSALILSQSNTIFRGVIVKMSLSSYVTAFDHSNENRNTLKMMTGSSSLDSLIESIHGTSTICSMAATTSFYGSKKCANVLEASVTCGSSLEIDLLLQECNVLIFDLIRPKGTRQLQRKLDEKPDFDK